MDSLDRLDKQIAYYNRMEAEYRAKSYSAQEEYAKLSAKLKKWTDKEIATLEGLGFECTGDGEGAAFELSFRGSVEYTLQKDLDGVYRLLRPFEIVSDCGTFDEALKSLAKHIELDIEIIEEKRDRLLEQKTFRKRVLSKVKGAEDER